ncbi:WD repeat and coiled-coil-containing protein isoform X2 [Phascolarctos cinereus]|uniref:WD repeat and coiled-coil-containing protein n=1 Tax=Phascolarctos cinereus TaxID=38626 RepID=A0A6P5JHF4_PHACI|nr:WD repeat and coiled-coil-containing protein isoform X2 [Phascolarctos cinereus]
MLLICDCTEPSLLLLEFGTPGLAGQGLVQGHLATEQEARSRNQRPPRQGQSQTGRGVGSLCPETVPLSLGGFFTDGFLCDFRYCLIGRMELGKGKLLRTGLNALYQAVHPVHGIAWTDGKQVVLTALQLQNAGPTFGDSRIMGQFEHVHGLSWGPPGAAGSPTLLAVQHKKHVSVWQLCSSLSERSRLLVSQTCEVGEPHPVLPQGCVWHPHKAILTVLTSRDVSVLHSVHCDSSRVKADLVRDQGFVHCACWTHDGHRLVVAVGSALHSFMWDDSQKTLHACSFCPVFDVGSHICSVLATVDMQIAVATELPLDKICSLHSMEAFEISTAEEMQPSPSSLAGIVEEPSVEPGKASPDSEPSFSSSSLDSGDLTLMPPGGHQCDSSLLFRLQEKGCLSGAGQDSSHLVLVTFDRTVTTSRKVGIPGVLVPDLLAFDPKSQVVAVASNTCHIILIYSLSPSSAPGVQCIRLETCERPKGICFLSDKLLLILVGKQKVTDPTFLPSSKSDKYTIRLVVREVTFEGEPSWKSDWSQQDFCNVSTTLGLTSERKPGESHCPIFYPQMRELLIPGKLHVQPLARVKTLIEEITVTPWAQSPRPNAALLSKPMPATDAAASVQGLEAVSSPWSPAPLGPDARPGSPKTQCRLIHEPLNLPQDKASMKEKEDSRLCRVLERLSGSFTDLHQRLLELIDLLHGKEQPPSPTTYPLSQDPSFLLITCQKPSPTGPVVDKRAVLLCDGKVRLQTVQQVFGLSLVEMQHGSLWILLSADSEGFIPLTFLTSQEITIRDGSGSRLGSPTQ